MNQATRSTDDHPTRIRFLVSAVVLALVLFVVLNGWLDEAIAVVVLALFLSLLLAGVALIVTSLGNDSWFAKKRSPDKASSRRSD